MMLAKSQDIHERRLEILMCLSDKKYLRPMDVGGFYGSTHSDDLIMLVRMGLVTRRQFGGYVRPSYRYRRNPGALNGLR